jgi:hypothetical protein
VWFATKVGSIGVAVYFLHKGWTRTATWGDVSIVCAWGVLSVLQVRAGVIHWNIYCGARAAYRKQAKSRRMGAGGEGESADEAGMAGSGSSDPSGASSSGGSGGSEGDGRGWAGDGRKVARVTVVEVE